MEVGVTAVSGDGVVPVGPQERPGTQVLGTVVAGVLGGVVTGEVVGVLLLEETVGRVGVGLAVGRVVDAGGAVLLVDAGGSLVADGAKVKFALVDADAVVGSAVVGGAVAGGAVVGTAAVGTAVVGRAVVSSGLVGRAVAGSELGGSCSVLTVCGSTGTSGPPTVVSSCPGSTIAGALVVTTIVVEIDGVGDEVTRLVDDTAPELAFSLALSVSPEVGLRVWGAEDDCAVPKELSVADSVGLELSVAASGTTVTGVTAFPRSARPTRMAITMMAKTVKAPEAIAHNTRRLRAIRAAATSARTAARSGMSSDIKRSASRSSCSSMAPSLLSSAVDFFFNAAVGHPVVA